MLCDFLKNYFFGDALYKKIQIDFQNYYFLNKSIRTALIMYSQWTLNIN